MKRPKRPRIYYYYGVILIILMLFNLLPLPRITQRQVIEVDYGTFLSMTEEEQVGRAEIRDQENVICFTDQEETKIYAKSEDIKFSDLAGEDEVNVPFFSISGTRRRPSPGRSSWRSWASNLAPVDRHTAREAESGSAIIP